MALRERLSDKWQTMNLPLSYRVNEKRPRLQATKNTVSKDRLDTRNGTSRVNDTSIGGSILSTSFFKDKNGNKNILAKYSTVLYKVSSTGAHTPIKTGLTSTTKHRGISWNSRHIIAIEEDGLFQWDGTTFTQLGQAIPSTPNVVLVNGQGSLSDDAWQVKITFYSSVNGWESNPCGASATITTTTPNSRITISAIPTTASNATIDKIRIYASNDTINYFLVDTPNGDGSIDLGTSTFDLDDDPTSTHQPPEENGTPPTTGKYIVNFNGRLAVAGMTDYESEVWISEQDIPDGFDKTDNAIVLVASGDGNITGLGVGLFNDSVLNPYLVVFKRNSTWVYSEIAGIPSWSQIDADVGCLSHDTIISRNGSIYFMSDSGWKVINNGRLIIDEGDAISLGLGDIDDIFRRETFDYSLTRSQLTNCFSCYYGDLDQYITWVADAKNSTFKRAYVYQFDLPGFTLFEFYQAATSCCIGEDGNGRCVLFSDAKGFIYKYSLNETRKDNDHLGNSQAIEASAVYIWRDGEDMAVSYNFRDLYLRAINSSYSLTVYASLNYDFANYNQLSYDFASSGFVLDVSRLDEEELADSRQIVTSKGDVLRSGENIAIEFYQKEALANMGIVAMQLDFNKNGNRN